MFRTIPIGKALDKSDKMQEAGVNEALKNCESKLKPEIKFRSF